MRNKSNTIYIFNLNNKTWRSYENDYPKRACHTATKFSNKMFVFGGYEQFGNKPLEVNLDTFEWDYLKDISYNFR